MIKINLLRDPSRRRQKAWVPKASSRIELYVGIAVVAAIIGVLGWHYYLTGMIRDANVQRAQLQEQSQQLAAARAELIRYEEQRRLLEERAGIIEQLRASQKGPVQLMNAIISSMPSEPRLWLLNLSQEGQVVRIQGRAFDVPAIADFIANLNERPPFDRVELSYWQDERNSLSFGLNCFLKVQ